MRKLIFLLSAFTLVLSCSSDETSTPVTPPAPIVKYTITLSAGVSTKTQKSLCMQVL